MNELCRWWRGAKEVAKVEYEHPSDAWVISEREETGIYLERWVDELQSKRELWTLCPWWLDYPDEEIPESEVELHKSKTINIT